MEESSFNLNAQKILKKVFTANVKGYDPDEVDKFLDEVIADYATFDRYYVESKKYIVQLETQNRRIKEDNQKIEQERALLKNRFDGIKESDAPSSENIEMLNRIAKLEAELYRLGVNPRDIK